MRYGILLLIWTRLLFPGFSYGEENGRDLFTSTALGSSGLSCSSCHPDGRGLHEIDAYDDGQLREMINFCIRDALKRELLPADAPQLQKLFVYLRSLKVKP